MKLNKKCVCGHPKRFHRNMGIKPTINSRTDCQICNECNEYIKGF